MKRDSESERASRLIVGGVLLVVVATLVVTAMRNPVSLDAFWHLRMGQDWVVNGLSPWQDHYSYTYFQQAISNPPVLFQAALHYVTSLLGVRHGFQAFKLLCFLLTLGAAFAALRQISAKPLTFAWVLPMIAFLLQLRATVRPELVAYPLTIVALMMYFRAGDRLSLRKVVPMIALVLLWTLYHRSSIVGYVIFGCYFLDCAFSQWRNGASAAEWMRWLGLGALTVAVGFLNPSFSHPLIESVTFDSQWKLYISEYRFGTWLLGYPATYVLMLLALLTPVLAIMRKKYGFLLCCLVLTYATIESARLVSLSGIVITLMFAHLVTGFVPPGRWLPSLARPAWLGALLAMTIVLPVLASNVMRSQDLMAENRTTINRYPQALAGYMKKAALAGKVHNEFLMGGYLVYELGAQNRFYIDGRTHILYPPEHLKRFMESIARPEVLREEVDQHGVDIIALIYDEGRHDTVMSLGDFELDFMDRGFALYTRGNANFPVLGRLLWQPSCWRREWSRAVQDERRKMDTLLPWYSGLYPFANLVAGVDQAEDPLVYLDNSFAQQRWDDAMRRFAGFQLMITGQDEIAAAVFADIGSQGPQDMLATAAAHLNAGNHDAASGILAHFSTVAWPALKDHELQLLGRLYQGIEQTRGLRPEEQVVFNKIAGLVALQSRPPVESKIGPGDFCTLGESFTVQTD